MIKFFQNIFKSRILFASLRVIIHQKRIGGKMLKTELKVINIGKPDITALSETERKVFIETLLERIKHIYEENHKQQNDK